MKQMRSRFRFITLLLVCGFLLTLAVCTGSALKTAGVSLSSLSALSGLPAGSGTFPSPSVSPDASPSPVPSEMPSDSSVPPETDNSTDQEYNVFGL